MASDTQNRDTQDKVDAKDGTTESRTTLNSDSILHSGLLDNRDPSLDKVHDYHLDQDMGESMEQVNANLHLGSKEDEQRYGEADDPSSGAQGFGFENDPLEFTSEEDGETANTNADQFATLVDLPQESSGFGDDGAPVSGGTQVSNGTPASLASSLDTGPDQTFVGSAFSDQSDGSFSTQNSPAAYAATSGEGGDNSPIAATGVITSDLSAVTDIDESENTVDENSAAGSATGIRANASTAEGASVVYSLLDDAGGLFSIDPETGIVSVAGALDAETSGSHQIVVLATGSDGATQTETFTIAIRDVNEYDVSAIETVGAVTDTISEGVVGGSQTGITVVATDKDVTDSVTYSVDDPRFVIDDQGVVSVAEDAVFDAETEATVSFTVTATSTDGSQSTQTFTLAVADENEFATTALQDVDTSANTVSEDAAAGTLVGVTAFAEDKDITDTVSYSVDDARFTVDENGVVRVADGASFDAETEGSIKIIVTATSTDGSSSTETFAIAVSDANESAVTPVTDMDASANSIAENVSAGTQVGITVLATDSDITDTVSYSVDDTRFTVDENGVVRVADGASFDFESEPNITLTVTATSTDGSMSSEAFSVSVTDVAEDYQLEDGGQSFTDISVAETSITGGSGDDAIIMHADGGTVDGAAGNDTIFGNEAADTLAGGEGDDTIEGGAGNDTIFGENAPVSGTWHYQVYDHNFSGEAGQTGDISSGTLIDEGTIDAFDLDTVVQQARGSSENPEDFGVILTSNFTAADGGTYRFSTRSDDGSTIEIFDAYGNRLTFTNQNDSQTDYLDNDYHQSATTRWADVDLEPGEIYTIVVKVWENQGKEVLEATVTPPGGAAEDLFTSDFVSTAAVIPGDDILTGGAGDDTIDGGLGTDTAVFSGNFADYTITESEGIFTVTDNRSGSPDGTDTVVNVENFRFADGDILAGDLIAQDITGVTDRDRGQNTVSEDAAAGTTVGVTAFADDKNASDTVSYTVDDDRFVVDENGVVRVADGAIFDAETEGSIDIVVTATSTDGSTSQETFTISVSDVDEYDVSAVSDTDAAANTISEDAKAGTDVGITAHASDADVTATVSYSVDDDRFTVDTNGVVRVADGASFDAETEGSIDVVVTATSSDGSTSSETFTIRVADVNETAVSDVTDTDSTDNSISEEDAAGTQVGVTAQATDADASDTVSYSVNDSRFTIDENGVVRIADGASFDAETEGSIDITVTATSTDGSTSTETFTVSVSDFDEYDVSSVSDTDAAANEIAEDATASTQVGITALASDADVSDTVSYSVNDNRFNVDENGVIRVAEGASFDAETEDSIDIVVTATSTDGSVSEETFTIAVSDVNETAVSAVTDVDAAANGFAEDAAEGSTVGITVQATDDDAADTVSYTVSDDRFTVGADGVITVAAGAAFDYESEPTIDLTVTATSSDGSTSQETFTLSVADVAESYQLAEGQTTFTDTGVAETSITGNDSADTITAHDDGSTIYSGAGDDTIYGGSGNDTILFGEGADVVYGGAGDDFIDDERGTQPNTGDNYLDGGDGNDTMYGGSGNDTLIGGSGNDTLHGENDDDTLQGDAGNDKLYGDAGNDTLDGGDGNDILKGGSGDDSIDGGSGTDTVIYSGNRSDYDITDNADGSYTVVDTRTDGSEGTDTVINVETFRFADGDVLAGDLVAKDISAVSDTDTASNTIFENAEEGSTVGITAFADDENTSDTVSYTVDDARFTVDADGTVRVAAGASFDYESEPQISITVTATSTDGSSSSESFTLSVSDAAENLQLADGGVTFTDIGVAETTITGGTGDDAITAHSSGGSINGGEGNDTLTGSSGSDKLQGGAGNDALTGGAGADLLQGGAGDDTFQMGGDGTWSGYSARNTVTGDTVSISGRTINSDVFEGGDGTDTLRGTDAADAIFLDDTYSDMHAEASGPRLVSIENVNLGAGDDILDMTSDKHSYTTDMTVDGGVGNDVIWTGAGNDTILGGEGNDTLFGGAGNDRLDGGAGTDKAIYSGNWEDYDILQNDDGSYTITDLRADAPDGVDTVSNVETYRFADGELQSDELIDRPVGDVSDTNSSGNTIHELDGAGTQVGITAFAEDPNGDAVTYTLSDDRFEIDADGVVTVADHAFFDSQVENSIDLTVTATSADGSQSSQAFAISVTGEYDGEFTGGDGGGTFTGTDKSYSVDGVGGDDTITTGDFDDRIDGGANGGNDTLDGGGGNDLIFGRGGDDEIYGGTGNDTIIGGAGNDTLNGGDGSDLFMYGLGDGSDTINAGAGAGWTDVIDLGGGPGITSAGVYETDWTVTITNGSIEMTDTEGGRLDLSQDADGYIDFADGSRVNFSDVEEIRW